MQQKKKTITTYSDKLFAEKFRRLMFERRLTLLEISRAISVPLSTLSTWKRGRVPRTAEKRELLARIFGVGTGELFGGDAGAKPVFSNESPDAPSAQIDECAELRRAIVCHAETLAQSGDRRRLAKILAKLEKVFPLGR